MKEHRSYALAFYGKGYEYFKIQIVNTILNFLSLSLYYPWAKERSLKYLYNKNTFEETPFIFSGTGKEMFKGYIKALAILLALMQMLEKEGDLPNSLSFLSTHPLTKERIPFCHTLHEKSSARSIWTSRFGAIV